jgi:hypothetical protein
MAGLFVRLRRPSAPTRLFAPSVPPVLSEESIQMVLSLISIDSEEAKQELQRTLETFRASRAIGAALERSSTKQAVA